MGHNVPIQEMTRLPTAVNLGDDSRRASTAIIAGSSP
uniref:Uncharacterized protein n=1 Tax=Klebsiella phage FKP3 TaxID=3231233 RepID=A0AAU8HZS0_9CAUD